jgi:hypothetical protein
MVFSVAILPDQGDHLTCTILYTLRQKIIPYRYIHMINKKGDMAMENQISENVRRNLINCQF